MRPAFEEEPHLDGGGKAALRFGMLKITVAIVACLLLAGCANADGSLPRLASPDGGPGPSRFSGGYSGASGSFGTLPTGSTSF